MSILGQVDQDPHARQECDGRCAETRDGYLQSDGVKAQKRRPARGSGRRSGGRIAEGLNAESLGAAPAPAAGRWMAERRRKPDLQNSGRSDCIPFQASPPHPWWPGAPALGWAIGSR